jgi:hypothetical protein
VKLTSDLFLIILTLIICIGFFKFILIYRKYKLKKKYNSDKPNIAIILITKPFRKGIFKTIDSFLFDEFSFLIFTNIEKVLNYFKNKKKEIKVYININSTDFEKIMENKHIKEVYIYSHGSRYGVCLNDKYYEYKNLNKDLIFKKNYVAQLHCGKISKNNSTGITLEEFTQKIFYFNKNIGFLKIRKYNLELIKGNKPTL